MSFIYKYEHLSYTKNTLEHSRNIYAVIKHSQNSTHKWFSKSSSGFQYVRLFN